MSSAIVAVEKRPDGRKSADIFLPSNYKMSQANVYREERKDTKVEAIEAADQVEATHEAVTKIERKETTFEVTKMEEKIDAKYDDTVDIGVRKDGALEKRDVREKHLDLHPDIREKHLDLHPDIRDKHVDLHPDVRDKHVGKLPVADNIMLADGDYEDIPMEEVLRRELERQKLIQQKLKEIEEQNKILAELEARENILRQAEEVRRRQRVLEENMRLKKDEKVSQIEARKEQETKMQEAELVEASKTNQVQQVLDKNEKVQELSAKEIQLSTIVTPSQSASNVMEYEPMPPFTRVEMDKINDKTIQPPQVPGRSSSRNVLRDMSFSKINSPQPAAPHLQLVNVSVSPAPSSRLSTSPSLDTLSPNIIQVRLKIQNGMQARS